MNLWWFLSRSFYSMEADNDPDRRALLKKAEHHLENYKKENPYKFLSRFVTVKLLLGNPTEEVKAAFPSLDKLETKEQEATMLATYGRSCEINNRFQEALQKYQQVLSYDTGENRHLWYFRTADEGIRRIREQLNR